ncbi:MAG: Gfo/Idh/MocA family oxidoreductase [Candidatus Poribacteria bacterium]|nr:Gfo/Idh/MocA family oxidoreductase [Candidatus Poribacteria bacterium]
MSYPISVAILGIGQRGLQHLRALWKLQGEGLVKIVALIDTFEDNLVEAKIQKYVDGFQMDGIHTAADFSKTIAELPLDAIYFAIPPGVHNGELIEAANAGIHIFAEKPMSLYMNEALEMDRVIRDNGVISTVGFQQRYDRRYEATHDFLADKQMVMVTMLMNGALEAHSVKHTITETLGGPANRVWTANFEWSGSTVVEAGIHQTDLMRYWCGDIVWVEADYIHRDPTDIVDGGDNPYAYTVKFGFESGCIANLLLSRLRKVYYSDGYQSLLWTHGHLKFEGNDVVAYYYDGPYPPAQTPQRESLRHVLPLPSGVDPTEQISRAFLRAIATGSTDGLRSTFASSINSLAAVLGANASDQLGGKRTDLKDFLVDEKSDRFRRKPADTNFV